jgi:hypothetical protein
VAVVEVQRFWARFEQLGCDQNGNLPMKAIKKSDLGEDTFINIVNIFSNLIMFVI